MAKRDEEKTKLSATFMNGAALAALSIGVVTPLVAYFYGIPPISNDVGPWTFVSGVPVWTTVAIVLHLAARGILDALDE